MTRVPRPPLLALALALVGACGDDLVPTLPLADLATAMRDAECVYLTRCGLFEDELACRGFLSVVEDRDLRDAVARGAVRYDGVRALACTAMIADQACDQTALEVRRRPACEAVFVPLRAAGATCALDAVCISGRCLTEACPDACCLGTCAEDVPRGAPGDACLTTADCDASSFCGPQGSCEPLVMAGAPCRRDDECVEGAACILVGLMGGTCRPLPRLGEACPYGRCAEIGARCDLASGTCVSWGAGAPCEGDGECSFYGLCDPMTGTCGPVPTLGLACVTRCGGDAWCDRASSPPVCAPLKPDGAACATADQCASRVCEEGPAFDACVTPAPCA